MGREVWEPQVLEGRGGEGVDACRAMGVVGMGMEELGGWLGTRVEKPQAGKRRWRSRGPRAHTEGGGGDGGGLGDRFCMIFLKDNFV